MNEKSAIPRHKIKMFYEFKLEMIIVEKYLKNNGGKMFEK